MSKVVVLRLCVLKTDVCCVELASDLEEAMTMSQKKIDSLTEEIKKEKERKQQLDNLSRLLKEQSEVMEHLTQVLKVETLGQEEMKSGIKEALEQSHRMMVDKAGELGCYFSTFFIYNQMELFG